MSDYLIESPLAAGGTVPTALPSSHAPSVSCARSRCRMVGTHIATGDRSPTPSLGDLRRASGHRLQVQSGAGMWATCVLSAK